MRTPAFALAIPFILAAIFFAIFIDHRAWKAYLVGGSIIPLVFIYIFRPQIEWWWFSRNPQSIHPKMREILIRFFPFYGKLSQDNQKRFEHRMALYMHSKTYEKKVIEIIPEDLKGLIAANQVQLTFGLREFLSPKFEVIVFYPNRFPSPQINDFHASEVFEDGEFGGMIFAIDHIMPGLQDPKKYNIVMHELANLLWIKNQWSPKDFTEFATPENVLKLAKVRGINTQKIKELLGKPTMNFYAVVIEHFFANPRDFQTLLPNLYKAISKKLNQNPLEESNPVVIDVQIEKKE